MKPRRYELLPWDSMGALAEHMAKGSAKYTTEEELSCLETLVRLQDLVSSVNDPLVGGTAQGVVDLATRTIFDKLILISQSVSEQTVETGETEIGEKSGREIGYTNSDMTFGNEGSSAHGNGAWHPSDLPSKMSSDSPPTDASPAVGHRNDVGSILTMITSLEASEDSSVASATKALDFSETIWKALEELSSISVVPHGTEITPTLFGFTWKVSGDRNWEKGYNWSLGFGSLIRHSTAWFHDGEDIDEETQSHHLAGALFHAATLLAFAMRGVGIDDRPGARE